MLLHFTLYLIKRAMNEVINQIRVGFVAIWAVVASALAPTVNALLFLCVCSIVNMLIGYLSNMVTKGERFSMTKMLRAFVQLLFYMGLVILLHCAFWIFDELTASEIAIRAVCWVGVWGYLVKILQNFLLVFPDTQGIKLLYYLLSVKFIPQVLGRIGIDVSEDEMKTFNSKEK